MHNKNHMHLQRGFNTHIQMTVHNKNSISAYITPSKRFIVFCEEIGVDLCKIDINCIHYLMNMWKQELTKRSRWTSKTYLKNIKRFLQYLKKYIELEKKESIYQEPEEPEPPVPEPVQDDSDDEDEDEPPKKKPRIHGPLSINIDLCPKNCYSNGVRRIRHRKRKIEAVEEQDNAEETENQETENQETEEEDQPNNLAVAVEVGNLVVEMSFLFLLYAIVSI